jgi:hypothetical protein
MARTHEQNLDCIRQNLSRANSRAAHNPTHWNVTQAASLREAEEHYLRFMAGEIQRRDMCHTAQELTMNMPDWGTRGT